MMGWICVLLVCLSLTVYSQAGDIQVYMGNGRSIIGQRKSIGHGESVDEFLGIPYAKPPVGDLRFRRPEPYTSSKATFRADTPPNSCYQGMDTAFGMHEGVTMWNPNTKVSEDCLYLNVWRPSNKGRDLAVLVWIYGGGFSSGSSTLDIYDGSQLAATGGVVIVSMQYRVGFFGFAYMGDKLAPGNQGLLDQRLAIQWVHKNINQFGGDKDKITLLGESAGAGSVSLHLLSPLTQPLISGAIMESGSAAAIWAYDTPEVAESITRQVAAHAGCAGETSKDVMSCMQGKNADVILNAFYSGLEHKEGDTTCEMEPTLDNYFLTESVEDLLNNLTFKNINIIIGSNTNEGSYFLPYRYPKMINLNNSLDISYLDFNDMIGNIIHNDNPDLVEEVAQHYADKDTESADYTYALDNVLGDYQFICPVIKFGELYDKAGLDVYMYRFTHRTSANTWPEWMGVMHGYELDHVFGKPLDDSLNYNTDEKTLSRKVIRLFSNYAKDVHKDPNFPEELGSKDAKWEPFTRSHHNFIRFDTGDLEKGEGIREKQCKFWNDEFPELRATLGVAGLAGSSCLLLLALLAACHQVWIPMI